VSTLQLALIGLVGVPLGILLIAYVARWIAGYFFSSREAELAAVTCCIAWFVSGGFKTTSTYLIILGICGFIIGMIILHKLWRPSHRVGATDNG
jgi:hypothetical protein